MYSFAKIGIAYSSTKGILIKGIGLGFPKPWTWALDGFPGYFLKANEHSSVSFNWVEFSLSQARTPQQQIQNPRLLPLFRWTY